MLVYNPSLPLFSLHVPKTAGTSFENVLQGWFNGRYFPNVNNHPRIYTLVAPLKLDFFAQRLLGCGLYLHYSNEFLKKPPRIIPLGLKYGLVNRVLKQECVHGHFDAKIDGGNLFDFYPQAKQFITFLRDPLEMQLSLFFYNKRMIESGNMYWQGQKVTTLEYDGDIDRWVEERGSFMLDFLPMKFTTENFIDEINSQFVHIGVAEKMQKSVDLLSDKLGFKRCVVPNENVTARDISPSTSSVSKFKEKHKLEYLIYNYALSLNS